MRPLLVSLVLVLAPIGPAMAYVEDRVSIAISAKDDRPESQVLAHTLEFAVAERLNRAFPCLRIVTRSEVAEYLKFLHLQRLLGMPEDQELGGQWDWAQLNDDARYVVTGSVDGGKYPNVDMSVRAARKDAKDGGFFVKRGIVSAVEVVDTVAESWAQELLDAFVKRSSKVSSYNEVCPYKGPVTVTATIDRRVPAKPTKHEFVEFCNGEDRPGWTSEWVTWSGSQTWKLQRYGSPDTSGTVDYSLSEESVREEMNGCYRCKSGRKGGRTLRDETTTLRTVTWLSQNKKWGETHKDDATIRLQFSPDGTYMVSVRASTAEGSVRKTRRVTAEGTCDVEHPKDKPEPPGVFTESLEASFGPFNGSVTDLKLAGKKTQTIIKTNGEALEYTIDFELEHRPR